MAGDPPDEHRQVKRLIREELSELAAVYPYLPRVDSDLQYIESAFRDGDEKLEQLIPFIDSYAHLKIRGYLGQVIFMFVFMDIGKLKHLMQMNYASEGARLIESSQAYQAEFAEQFLRLDLDTIWNEHIAYRELFRLVKNGYADRVRNEAMKMADCVTASYTLCHDPQFEPRKPCRKLKSTRAFNSQPKAK
jgi:hypothetical protein